MELKQLLAIVVMLGSLEISAASPLQQRSNDDKSTKTGNDMLQLSEDSDFHYELVRTMDYAPYEGSDVAEVLVAAKEIKPGDYESFYKAFNNLADRTHTQALSINSTGHPVSARNAYFKAASYYRSADFFLHGNWTDPRISSLWTKALDTYNTALSLMPLPGRREVLTSKDGTFKIPTVFYEAYPSRKDGQSQHRSGAPTILLCNGYDGSQEEMYHAFGKAALERGLNVLTFEGPGQPTVRREQDLGFIPEWEKVVEPVLDYLSTLPCVKQDATGILGYSFGGYLVPRAAAKLPGRFAGVMAIDGLMDFGASILQGLGNETLALFQSGDKGKFDKLLTQAVAKQGLLPTSARWSLQQGLWSFNTQSPFDFITRAQEYNLSGLAEKIDAPVFIGDAPDDSFFPGQAKALFEGVGKRGTYHRYNAIDGAGLHCSAGASVLQNQVVLD
ncbi:hypothetical protein Q7P37_008742 [Cladosporium fusiforme]